MTEYLIVEYIFFTEKKINLRFKDNKLNWECNMGKNKQIMFVCPQCAAQKYVGVPPDVYKGSKSGTTPVVVPEGVVCEHEIRSYIDKNGNVRGYINFEYHIMSADVKVEKIKDKAKRAYESELVSSKIDFILDIMNRYDFLLFIESCYAKFPVILIENDLEGERFQKFYAFFALLFPKIAKHSLVYTMAEYDAISKDKIFSNYFIYNLTHNLKINSPCSVEESDNLKFLLNKKYFSRFIFFNNAIKYMERYGDIAAKFVPAPPKQRLKEIGKDKDYEMPDWVSIETIEMIIHRNEFIARQHLAMWKNDELLSPALKALIPKQKELDEAATKNLAKIEEQVEKLHDSLW